MLNLDVCKLCQQNSIKDQVAYTEIAWGERFWECPAIKGFICIDQSPPKGCHKLMEQGVAAARSVNIDTKE